MSSRRRGQSQLHRPLDASGDAVTISTRKPVFRMPSHSSPCNAASASSTNRRLSFFSSAVDTAASPTTCTMPLPNTRRLAPTIFAIGNAEVICTVGIPAFSSSVVIAAPLRVLVPHVEVRIIASMPRLLAFSAISRPIRRVFDNGLANPEVERNCSHNSPIIPSFSSSRMTSNGTSRSGS